MTREPKSRYQDLADGQLMCGFERGILTLTLNRPEKANALSSTILRGLVEVLQFAADDPELKAVVLTGSGDRIFSGGADLKEMEAAGDDAGFAARYYSLWEHTVDAIMRFPLPTIALINGACVAGGLSLALACDMRIATGKAFLSYPRVADGHLPGRHNLSQLVRLAGASRARMVMLCGYRVYASEAREWGLVDTLLESVEDLEAIIDPVRKSQRALLSVTKALISHPEDNAIWESAAEMTSDPKNKDN